MLKFVLVAVLLTLATVTGKPSGLVVYPPQFHYPGFVAATSSNVFTRTHNGILTPYVATYPYYYGGYGYPYRYPYYF
uniref:Uncharacterized protein n=1 Tax=Megaselia scalaris TaxID=36166 RepID=T1GAS5_MEGSC